MKLKNIFRVFLTAAFILGTMAMNAQTKVYVYKADGTNDEYNVADIDSISFTPPATEQTGNLLVNPGFENSPDGQTSDGLSDPWVVVPEDWFTSYYSGYTMPFATSYVTGNIASAASNNGAGAFFTGNGAPIADLLIGDYCARLSLSSTSGIYQVVAVTPGDYKVSVRIAFATTNTNQVIQDNNTVKVLSPDGATLYGEVSIPNDDQKVKTEHGFTGAGVFISPMAVTGTVTVPAGVTQVRFQLDQRDYTAAPAGPGRAALMLFDECEFSRIEN